MPQSNGFLKALNEFAETYRASSSCNPVAFHGASLLGEQIFHQFREKGIQVDFFVDNNPEKQGENFLGVPVIGQDEAINRNCTILITSSFFDEIVQGYLGKTEFACHHYLGCWILFDKLQPIVELYRSLSDETSRSTLSDLIDYYRGVRSKPTESEFGQYLHPQMHVPKAATIVDGGAYTGDTVEYFKKELGPKIKIIAFEPGQDQFPVLEQTASAYEQVICVKAGLWDKTTSLSFISEGAGTGAHVVENGTQTIEVMTFDEFNGDGPVDLIKLDVEGAEVNALKGAAKCIQQQRPNMAVCLYHSWQDWTDIPAMLFKYLPTHSVHFGHHSHDPKESVLYLLRKTD